MKVIERDGINFRATARGMDLVELRAAELVEGDVCAGSGALVLANYGTSGGKVSLAVKYPRSDAGWRVVRWNHGTTLRVWREPSLVPASARI